MRATLPVYSAIVAKPAAGWLADWSGFTLLGAAIYSKAAGVSVSLELRSGPRGEREYRTEPVTLRVGWNTLRLDLQDAGPLLDRSRVVQLAFRLTAAGGPTELVLDDLMLVNNREDVFGSPDGAAGTLYAQRAGERLIVGAAGRFELVFEGGRVVRCYDLAADPHRLTSACQNGPLGPTPLVLHPAMIEAGRTVSLDLDQAPGLLDAASMQRTQSLVEQGPLRAVVEGVWRSSPATTTQAADREVRWRYTVDRHGRVYVTLRTPTGGADRPPPQALLLDAAEGGRWEFDVQNPSDGIGRFARAAGRSSAAESARLTWIIPTFEGRVLLRSIRSAGSSMRAAIFADDTPARGAATLRSLLLLWPAAWSDRHGAEALFADAVRPATEFGGELAPFDFDHAAYRFSLRGGHARLTLGHDGVRRFWPMIELLGTAGLRIAATCDGALLTTDQRTSDGNVLLELPEIHRPSEIEVNVR